MALSCAERWGASGFSGSLSYSSIASGSQRTASRGNKAHVPSSAAASCSRENPEAILDGKPDTTCHDNWRMVFTINLAQPQSSVTKYSPSDLANVFGKFPQKSDGCAMLSA